MDRRTLLAGMIATLGSALLPGCKHGGEAPLFFSDRRPVGLQLYTLGDEAGQDFAATCAAVAALGYREIELPGLYGQTPAQLGAAARAAGLVITSVHVQPRARDGQISIMSDPAQIAEMATGLGAGKVVLPIHLLPHDFDPRGEGGFVGAILRGLAQEGADLWKRTAAVINRQGSALKSSGIALGYHNHNMEFAPVAGTRGWDILMTEIEPGNCELEIDTGWIATAGLDPAAFIARYRGRVTQLHLKDVAPVNPVNFALSTKPATVGEGVLDWPAILAAADAAGVSHYYLEQEPPFAGPRMEAVARGYRNLAAVRV